MYYHLSEVLIKIIQLNKQNKKIKNMFTKYLKN